MMLHALGDDIRNAVTSLRQSPAFTAVALIVLALGIGAATAIFSIVDAVVLRGLPFDEHDRIVAVLEHDRSRPATFGGGQTLPQNYRDWRAQQRSFTHLAASRVIRFRLRNANNEPDDALGLRVTWEFFHVLRVQPALGRAFTPDDEIDGRHRMVILSHGFWQRRFGGAPDVVGRTITLNDETWEVAGVMPRDFSYPVGSDQPMDLFTPLAFSAADRTRAGGRNYQYAVIGRLKDGVSIAQAAGEIETVNIALNAQYPGWNSLNPGGHIRIITLHERLVGRVRTWMLMVLASVALVLLIACANVANLMLARATVRAREVGIRAALGASTWRLTRGLLVEGIVLSLAGACIGVVLAYAGVHVLKGWIPAGIPRVADIAIDLRVLGAAMSAAVLTGGIFGMVPAIHGARPDLTTALREGGRSSTPGAGGQRLRNILVIAEVALALMLVVGAGLFLGSFAKLMRIDPGFEYRGVLTLDVGVPLQAGTIDERLNRGRAYVQRMLEAVRSVPGVEMAEAVSGGVPLTGSRQSNWVTLPGRGELRGEGEDIDTRIVTHGYLELLRAQLRHGRHLTRDDRGGAPGVIVINEAAARLYWPGQDALGQRMTIDKKEWTVVGIAGDIRHGGPETPPRPEGYMPLAQKRVTGAALVMRTAGDPTSALPAVKAAIWSVNPDQRLSSGIVTLDRYMDRLIAQRRFTMALLTLFGGVGLVIAAVGLYGVMAYVVAQRVTEIGVRVALGATPGRIVAMVLRKAGLLVALGAFIGTIGAWTLSGGVRAFLFQTEPHDSRVFIAALLTLIAAALIASALPARRASRVDPVIALRSG